MVEIKSKKKSKCLKDIQDICKGESDNWFFENIDYAMGDGENIKFWDDEWTGRIALKVRMSIMYVNVVNKIMRVSKAGFWENNT